MPFTRLTDFIFGTKHAAIPVETHETHSDFSDVRGQDAVKRAIVIAVAGGHNLLMIGPPGSGKSMLAKRVPSILPPLTGRDLQETNAVYAATGGWYRSTEPPFQAPHHTTSYAALIGGGSRGPKPGAVSLAHNGVLFLDELPEFNRGTLESLRQPLEDGKVTVSRTTGTATYPARFMLIAAMNPCPCGYYPHCSCKIDVVRKYKGKVSGPIMDRIDLHVRVPNVSFSTLDAPPGEASEIMRGHVLGARWTQYVRAGKLNATLEIGDFDRADTQAMKDALRARPLLEKGDRYSARGCVRILRVARTIADLCGDERITTTHIEEAMGYRSK